MQKKVLVLGTGDYAAAFADVFDGLADVSIAGFIENLDRQNCNRTILGKPVYWIDEARHLSTDHEAICCLATPERSRFIEAVAAIGFRFATFAHPTAVVSGRSQFLEGVSLDAGVIVSAFTIIGRHVRVGRGATIGHHVTIGDYATIHPGSAIAGKCEIGSKVTIGIGATIVDGCRIGSGSYVAAGSVVTTNIPQDATVRGNPARVVRQG